MLTEPPTGADTSGSSRPQHASANATGRSDAHHVGHQADFRPSCTGILRHRAALGRRSTRKERSSGSIRSPDPPAGPCRRRPGSSSTRSDRKRRSRPESGVRGQRHHPADVRRHLARSAILVGGPASEIGKPPDVCVRAACVAARREVDHAVRLVDHRAPGVRLRARDPGSCLRLRVVEVGEGRSVRADEERGVSLSDVPGSDHLSCRPRPRASRVCCVARSYRSTSVSHFRLTLRLSLEQDERGREPWVATRPCSS